MSHDLYANFASVELANIIAADPLIAFATAPGYEMEVFATRDASGTWPHADGAVQLNGVSAPRARSFTIAIEFKRENEGIHGLLTGIGQSQAYLLKGFSGSALVIPASYSTLDNAGEYVRNVLRATAPNASVGVFAYQPPDLSRARPFEEKLIVIEPIRVGASVPAPPQWTSRVRTQWVHSREGSIFPDAIYRYLLAARECSSSIRPKNRKTIKPLSSAVHRLAAHADEHLWLSNTVGDSLPERTWRRFWFGSILTREVQTIWSNAKPRYEVNNVSTNLVQWDGTPSTFFSGRRDSPKQTIVKSLNDGEITEKDAWQRFAENIRKRAHSLREDIDSFVEPAGLVDVEGRLTPLGNEFVDSCQRAGFANAEKPLALLRRAYLVEGDILALLHYIHRLTVNRMSADPTSFMTPHSGNQQFDGESYAEWLRSEMATSLKVMATSTLRGGVKRKPFQAEFAILRKLGLVGDMRMGVGLEINWPLVHETLSRS